MLGIGWIFKTLAGSLERMISTVLAVVMLYYLLNLLNPFGNSLDWSSLSSAVSSTFSSLPSAVSSLCSSLSSLFSSLSGMNTVPVTSFLEWGFLVLLGVVPPMILFGCRRIVRGRQSAVPRCLAWVLLLFGTRRGGEYSVSPIETARSVLHGIAVLLSFWEAVVCDSRLNNDNSMATLLVYQLFGAVANVLLGLKESEGGYEFPDTQERVIHVVTMLHESVAVWCILTTRVGEHSTLATSFLLSSVLAIGALWEETTWCFYVLRVLPQLAVQWCRFAEMTEHQIPPTRSIWKRVFSGEGRQSLEADDCWNFVVWLVLYLSLVIEICRGVGCCFWRISWLGSGLWATFRLSLALKASSPSPGHMQKLETSMTTAITELAGSEAKKVFLCKLLRQAKAWYPVVLQDTISAATESLQKVEVVKRLRDSVEGILKRRVYDNTMKAWMVDAAPFKNIWLEGEWERVEALHEQLNEATKEENEKLQRERKHANEERRLRVREQSQTRAAEPKQPSAPSHGSESREGEKRKEMQADEDRKKRKADDEARNKRALADARNADDEARKKRKADDEARNKRALADASALNEANATAIKALEETVKLAHEWAENFVRTYRKIDQKQHQIRVYVPRMKDPKLIRAVVVRVKEGGHPETIAEMVEAVKKVHEVEKQEIDAILKILQMGKKRPADDEAEQHDDQSTYLYNS